MKKIVKIMALMGLAVTSCWANDAFLGIVYKNNLEEIKSFYEANEIHIDINYHYREEDLTPLSIAIENTNSG